MQTFLPYPSYAKSARSLDFTRLGKQRVETLQVLNKLTGRRIENPQALPDEWVIGPVSAGWGNHPMTRMWQGYELSLLRYGLIVCRVWSKERGGRNDTCAAKMRLVLPASMTEVNGAIAPPWVGDPDFHKSHQVNLVDKAKQYYLHHADRPHRPHGQGSRRCDGNTPHKPHRNCDPKLMWHHYRPQFPDVPVSKGTEPVAMEYIWPV